MLANWPSEGSTVYYRSYITEITENSIKAVNDNQRIENPLHLARTSSIYLVDDRDAKKSELKKGTQVVLALKKHDGENDKYIAGVISKFVFRWYEIQISDNGQFVWKDIKDIRLRKLPPFCNRLAPSNMYRDSDKV